MYGSSLRIETWRPRALRSRPMLAAVMPLPREEVTPPVTKTYFAMGRVLRGVFRMVPEWPNLGKTGGRLTRLEPADEWTNKLKRVECIHGESRFVAAYSVAHPGSGND